MRGVVLVVLATALCSRAEYVASAVQMAPVGSFSQSPSANIEATQAMYEKLTVSSRQSGVRQMLVFPEAVIWPFGLTTRANMVLYANVIDGELGAFCGNASRPSQLQFLACMAQNYGVVVVANIIEQVICTSKLADCPPDGFFLFNTDVVFDENGFMLAKYHKSHIFGTSAILNQPSQISPSFFTTSFGETFGLVRFLYECVLTIR